MGPKKKGKQNKLARMSDEERLRYLQHKAAMEEEARRRKQQLIATFVKSKLKREEAFTRLNQAKIHEQWRHILRKAKCKELQQELEMSRQSFEYLLKRKEQVILSLQGDLQESESQYMVILQAHMEAVDKILLIGSSRIQEQARKFTQQRNELLELATQESKTESVRNKQAQQLLLTVLFATREAANSTQESMKSKALKKRTEILNNYTEEMQALQLRLGSHLENLQEQLLCVFRNYTTNTQEQRRMYEEMKERDSENLEIIANQAEAITKLQGEVDKLHTQLENLNIGSTPRTTKLEKQERLLSTECWRQRRKQQNIAKLNELKIRQLTTASSKCIEKLEKLKKKGDNILKIAQLCSRLETEEEKVILSHPLLMQEESSPETSESVATHDGYQEIQEDQIMSNFWRRHSQALLSRAALRMHYDTLMQENQRLRNALRHYLAATASCVTTALPSTTQTSSQTPLLVARRLRGRKISLIPITETRPTRPPVCIEAVIAAKTMLK